MPKINKIMTMTMMTVMMKKDHLGGFEVKIKIQTEVKGMKWDMIICST